MIINGLAIPDDTWVAISTHCQEAYPAEACGLMVGGAYWPAANAARDPSQGFFIQEEVWLRAADAGGVQAVVHSHPDGPASPSVADMTAQMTTAVPWVVVVVTRDGVVDKFAWGDSLPVADLVGRRFRHGTKDCYSLVRDWWRLERGILLPDFPRRDEWWTGGEDLYRQGYAQAGFQEIAKEDLTEGDGILFAIPQAGMRRTPPPNHAAVYLGGGVMLHHPYGGMSKREPVTRWVKYATHFLRRRA